jgi:hypothetical protein
MRSRSERLGSRQCETAGLWTRLKSGRACWTACELTARWRAVSPGPRRWTACWWTTWTPCGRAEATRGRAEAAGGCATLWTWEPAARWTAGLRTTEAGSTSGWAWRRAKAPRSRHRGGADRWRRSGAGATWTASLWTSWVPEAGWGRGKTGGCAAGPWAGWGWLVTAHRSGIRDHRSAQGIHVRARGSGWRCTGKSWGRRRSCAGSCSLWTTWGRAGWRISACRGRGDT